MQAIGSSCESDKCQCAIKPDLETYIAASQIAVAVVMNP